MKLYAGLDEKGWVYLYHDPAERGIALPVNHATWLELTKDLDLEPGEMPQVVLVKGPIPGPTEADIELSLMRLETRVEHLERRFLLHLGVPR